METAPSRPGPKDDAKTHSEVNMPLFNRRALSRPGPKDDAKTHSEVNMPLFNRRARVLSSTRSEGTASTESGLGKQCVVHIVGLVGVWEVCGSSGSNIECLAPFLEDVTESNEGIEAGLIHKRRFVRRGYVTAGPNQVWHADGFDKLKPFGIAISGCIDGFPRRVMWLRSGSTNSDPGIMVQHYLQCVSEFGLLPARLRTDCGTEDGTMAAINCTLRSQHTDDFAGALSHM
ncbi:hypothetical protein NQZ68_038325 [Dissostichus eleginoides]|nr:hypothetical protein NQZ68_038325 [Dissostichus eleginoides]